MFSRKDKTSQVLTEAGGGDVEPEPPARHSAKGAYGLKKCHNPPDAVADIVFVHGLTGNRETTWMDKSTGVFWPAHLLKNDVPKTRIVTFGYDADITHFFAAASQNCIRNHAINLANAVAQLRERTETEERPIIFVTHSLGGLVFEDAMLASRNSPEAHLQKVYDSTAGVCFLGTPHCGSTLANWGTVFGQIANTVKKINVDLLRVLEPESEVLARIQGDFHAMLRSRADQGRPPLAITCFFEELPVKGVGEIVPKHSAILSAYNSIGIHANHMDMARFTDEEDQGYLSVSTELLRWVRAIQKATQPGVPAAAAAAAARAPSPWADSSAAAQNPSASPWTEEPKPFPGTSATGGLLYPPGSQGHYQFPPGMMPTGYQSYYQGAPGPVHPTQQPATSPAEWQQSHRPPSASAGLQPSNGGYYIGSANGNTGMIVQGPVYGNPTM